MTGECPITKTEMARRCGVTVSRVSQWVSQGKIGDPAVVGMGRGAKIIESVARAQLRERLQQRSY